MNPPKNAPSVKGSLSSTTSSAAASQHVTTIAEANEKEEQTSIAVRESAVKAPTAKRQFNFPMSGKTMLS